MKDKDWKDRLNVVYSTNPDYNYQREEISKEETLPPQKQNLIVAIERKNRGGKTVTLVKGFVGIEDDLIELSRKIKTKCGVGGSCKDGEIIIQGDFKIRVADLLKEWGYKVKISG
ncbi:MAG: translation initiation factor [Tenuifilaceae bacterium]